MLYLVSCKEPVAKLNKIVYFKDSNTDICYAARISGLIIDYQSMTYVPCKKIPKGQLLPKEWLKNE